MEVLLCIPLILLLRTLSRNKSVVFQKPYFKTFPHTYQHKLTLVATIYINFPKFEIASYFDTVLINRSIR